MKKQPRHRPIDSAHPADDEEREADEAREAELAESPGKYLPSFAEIWQQTAALRETWSEADYRSHGSKPPRAWEPPSVEVGRPQHGKPASSFVERVIDDMG